MGLGSFEIVRSLLTARPQLAFKCPPVTISTLRSAILRGDVDVFQYLIEYTPNLHDRIHLEPWILLEAAALHEDSSTFITLARYGIYSGQTNDLSQGSALTAACAKNNLELVRYLYYLGANLCTTAVGYEGTVPRDRARHYHDLAKIGGLAALHIAVQNQNKEMVDFLVGNGADVNQCCSPLEPLRHHTPIFPIQIATYYGDEKIASTLLDAGADPNLMAGPLQEFARHPYTKIVGRSSLRIALEHGDEHLFKLLLSRGGRMLKPSINEEDWDPLISASQGGNHQLFRTVLQHFGTSCIVARKTLANYIQNFGCVSGAELISLCSMPWTEVCCMEVLSAAVEVGDVAFVRKLLGDTMTGLGELPPGYGAAGLALSVRLTKHEMVAFFLNAGIKPYDKPAFMSYEDRHGRHHGDLDSALEEAFSGIFKLRCHSRVERAAVEQLENLIIKCEMPAIGSHEHEIWTSVMFLACRVAVRCMPWFHILKLLISKGVDIDLAPPKEGSLLQLSLDNVDTKALVIAEYLLDIGASPYHQAVANFGGFSVPTALQGAAQSSPELTERLILLGADIHAKPAMTGGATALQMAANSGNFQTLKTLLKAGASINEPPGAYNGRTALEGAAENGRLNMVCFLLEAGADIEGRFNKNYWRTIYRAWERGHQTVIRTIQKWKEEKYGENDCEEVEIIVKSMTDDELDFESSDAKAEVIEWCARHDDIQQLNLEREQMREYRALRRFR